MASAPRMLHSDQLALDERLVDDPELEAKLEERERFREGLAESRRTYEEAHEEAVAEVAKLELPDGMAVRCGRFRIARKAYASRKVSFETKATSRIRISLLDGDDE